MGLVTIYDADGVKYEKETVDARECIQHLGFSYEKPEPKVEELPVIEKTIIVEEVVKSIKQKKAKEELPEEVIN